MKPPHPGDMLEADFLEPLHLTPVEVAKALDVPLETVERFIAGESAVTPELAIRLEHAFGWGADMWMRLQAHYDLEMVRRFGGVDVDHLPVLHAAE